MDPDKIRVKVHDVVAPEHAVVLTVNLDTTVADVKQMIHDTHSLQPSVEQMRVRVILGLHVVSICCLRLSVFCLFNVASSPARVSAQTVH